MDSTNLNPPALGPTFPIYPELPQLVRVYAAGVQTGGKPSLAYPGFVQQFKAPLSFRDREACYVCEPNDVALGAAIYDCRLVSQFQGLPLYATTCCVPGGGLAAASSSSSSPSVVTRTSLGKTAAYPATSVTLPGVTCPAGLLVAIVSVIGSGEGFEVTFGPYTLGADGSVVLPIGAALQGTLRILSVEIASALTADLKLSVTGGVAAALTLQGVSVVHLFDNLSDQVAASDGLASSPDSGATGQTTAAPEYAQGAFAMLTPPGSWVWKNGFASGGQDVSQTASGIATAVTEGWKNLPSIQSADAAITGTPAAWAGLAVTYS